MEAPPELLSGRYRLSFDTEEALEIVGDVGEPDLGPGPGQADGMREQAEAMLLGRDHRPHSGADLGAGAVGLAMRRRQVLAGLSPDVDL